MLSMRVLRDTTRHQDTNTVFSKKFLNSAFFDIIFKERGIEKWEKLSWRLHLPEEPIY